MKQQHLPGEGINTSVALSEPLIELGVDLAANAAAYPEMQREYSETEKEQLEKVKETLLGLPLVHTTLEKNVESARMSGIQVFADRPEGLRGHAGPLDESLGLTEYTFMHWGSAEKSRYSRHHLLVDSHLLLDPRTVVTPEDISMHNFWMDKPFEETPADSQRRTRDYYLAKMVTGSDWLEIVGRRVLAQATQGDLYELTAQSTLGEVKYHGNITPDMIQGVIRPEEEHDYWKYLIEHGFVPGPVARSFPFVGNDYDKRPEELGTTFEAGQAYWRELLAVEKPPR